MEDVYALLHLPKGFLSSIPACERRKKYFTKDSDCV